MNTPGTIPLDLLQQLLSPLANDSGCAFLVVEITANSAGNAPRFVGRVANRNFCQLLGVGENEILGQELPSSLSQSLGLPALLHELPLSGPARISRRDFILGPDRTCTLQAHLPCPELLTITLQNATPDQTTVSSQAEVILASLGDPCTIIDRNFFIIYENETAKELWGANCGKPCYTIYHGRQSRCESCHAEEVFNDGKIHKNEKTASLNGKEHHLEITSAPLKDEEGKITAVVNITHDVTVRKMTEKSKEHLIRELQASLAKTKRLNGLLPICSHCKKIKDDTGAWQQLESYLRSHAEVEFSHGICPECAEKHHPHIFKNR